MTRVDKRVSHPRARDAALPAPRMKASQFFVSTLKEAPADAEVVSHRLMMRAGLIKRLGAGIYNYMPMGLRVIRKIEGIIREEMNRAGAVELLMPVVQPAELWQESGRWQKYGPELLRVKDRHERDFIVQPTSEEVITDIARQELRSYKQLPRNFYHIQTKFRDERRPRFGIMRGREFTMKDAYSFDRDAAAAGRSYDAGNPALHDGDTIYLTTADADGNMVSLIQSNYRGMGSGITVPGTGFTFQDRGEMFTMHDPAHANAYAPGKRPFHTIIPAFITKDGAPWLSFGLMGGAMQPQGHVQIVCNLIDFGMNFQEAGDAARWQHEGSSDYDNPKMTDGGYVEVESGVPYESVRELQRRGHVVRIGNGGFGGYQAIHRDAQNGTYVGASESRKDGHAAGY